MNTRTERKINGKTMSMKMYISMSLKLIGLMSKNPLKDM